MKKCKTYKLISRKPIEDARIFKFLKQKGHTMRGQWQKAILPPFRVLQNGISKQGIYRVTAKYQVTLTLKRVK